MQNNQPGVLSFAKAGDDTNDSQLFVTASPQRMLDFNHSIVGQLIEGEEVRAAISRMETDANDRPTTPIQLESFEIFEDDRNEQGREGRDEANPDAGPNRGPHPRTERDETYELCGMGGEYV
jgi:hypothetical protein